MPRKETKAGTSFSWRYFYLSLLFSWS